MGLIDKIYKVAKTADLVTSITSKLGGGGSNILSGLNLGSFDINNLGSAGGNIQSMIDGMTSDITSGLDNAVDVNEIQNIASSIKPEDVGLDLSNIDTGIPGLDLNSLGLGGLNFF